MGFYTRVHESKGRFYICLPKEETDFREIRKGDYLYIDIEDVVFASDRNNGN